MRIVFVLLLSSLAFGGQIVIPLAPALARGAAATTGLPGYPALPHHVLTLALPPGADLASVRLRLLGARTAPAPVPTVETNPPIGILDGTKATPARPPYDAALPYPARFAEIVSTGRLGDIPMVRVRLFPLRLVPPGAERLLDGRLVLEFTQGATRGEPFVPGTAPLYLADAVNAAQAADWYAPRAEERKLLIVASKVLRQRSRLLETYVQAMRDSGWTVAVEAVESLANGAVGQARSERMRESIRVRAEEGFGTVLLIGNPDPERGEVPMKTARPLHDALVGPDYTKDTPTDYYYAELSGNWDLNGDGVYGRVPEDHKAGGVDAFPEVIVGRIPVYHGQAADLDDSLTRLLWFAGSPQPLERPFLLPDSVAFLPGEAGPGSAAGDGADLGEEFARAVLGPAGVPAVKLYEKAGLSPSPHACDLPLTEENLLSYWRQGAGGVLWYGHGGNDIVVRTIWARDDGDHVAEEADGEKEQIAFMISDDAWEAAPTTPSIVFAVACENGHPEYDKNLAARLVRTGAVAACGATRWASAYMQESNYTLHDSASGIGYRFFRNLIAGGMDAGGALMLAKTAPDLDYDEQPFWWQNIYGYNLYGDPTAAYRGGTLASPFPEPTIYWVRPQPEALIPCGEDLELTVKASGPGLAADMDPEAWEGLGAWQTGISDLQNGSYKIYLADPILLADRQAAPVTMGGETDWANLTLLPSGFTDGPDNVEGGYNIAGLDILETNSYTDGGDAVFTLRVKGGFSDPGDFMRDAYYAVAWWLDADRDGTEDYSVRFYMYREDEWAVAMSESDALDRVAAGFERRGDTLTVRVPLDFFPEGKWWLTWQIWTYATPGGSIAGYQTPADWVALCFNPPQSPGSAPVTGLKTGDAIVALNLTPERWWTFGAVAPVEGIGFRDEVVENGRQWIWEGAADTAMIETGAGIATFVLDREQFRIQVPAGSAWSAGDRAVMASYHGQLQLANLGRGEAVVRLGTADHCLLPNTVEEVAVEGPETLQVIVGTGVHAFRVTPDGAVPLSPDGRGLGHGWLAGAANGTGVNGTRWASRLTLANGGEAAAGFVLTLHKGGWAGETVRVTGELPADTSDTVENVMAELFDTEGFGTVEWEGPPSLQVYMQTYAEGTEDASQLILSAGESAVLTAGRRFALPADLGDLGAKVFWTNPGPGWATVKMAGTPVVFAPGAVIWTPIAVEEDIQIETGRLFALLSLTDAQGRPAAVWIGPPE